MASSVRSVGGVTSVASLLSVADHNVALHVALEGAVSYRAREEACRDLICMPPERFALLMHGLESPDLRLVACILDCMASAAAAQDIEFSANLARSIEATRTFPLLLSCLALSAKACKTSTGAHLSIPGNVFYISNQLFQHSSYILRELMTVSVLETMLDSTRNGDLATSLRATHLMVSMCATQPEFLRNVASEKVLAILVERLRFCKPRVNIALPMSGNSYSSRPQESEGGVCNNILCIIQRVVDQAPEMLSCLFEMGLVETLLQLTEVAPQGALFTLYTALKCDSRHRGSSEIRRTGELRNLVGLLDHTCAEVACLARACVGLFTQGDLESFVTFVEQGCIPILFSKLKSEHGTMKDFTENLLEWLITEISGTAKNILLRTLALSDNAKTRSNICIGLVYLSFGSDALRRAFLNEGGLDSMVSLLQTAEGRHEVQYLYSTMQSLLTLNPISGPRTTSVDNEGCSKTSAPDSPTRNRAKANRMRKLDDRNSSDVKIFTRSRRKPIHAHLEVLSGAGPVLKDLARKYKTTGELSFPEFGFEAVRAVIQLIYDIDYGEQVFVESGDIYFITEAIDFARCYKISIALQRLEEVLLMVTNRTNMFQALDMSLRCRMPNIVMHCVGLCSQHLSESLEENPKVISLASECTKKLLLDLLA